MWTTVSFWSKKLTDVPIRSFPQTQILSVIRIKAHGAKNKDFKPHVQKMYLTLKFKMIVVLSSGCGGFKFLETFFFSTVFK
jgi:hypothetical protein